MGSMRKINSLSLLLLAFSAQGQTIVHGYASFASFAALSTGLTSTTTGDTFALGVDSSTVCTSVQFTTGGSQAFTSLSSATGTVSNSVSKLTIWTVPSELGSQTAITGTGCGTVNAVHGFEASGLGNTSLPNLVDHLTACTSSSPCPASAGVLGYHPGYSAEAVLAFSNCSGNATTPFLTGSGISLTAAASNGQPGGFGTISSNAGITINTQAGCGATGAVAVGFKASGATKTCATDIGYYDYSALTTGSDPSISNVNVISPKDLIVVAAWALTGVTGAGTLSVGSDTATRTTVTGTRRATTGQPFIFYDIASAAGSQTISWVPSGSITGVQLQLAYYEFVPSGGCTFFHDIDSMLGTGDAVTINTPSITPTGAGEVLYNFTAYQGDTTAVNSPWTCNVYGGSGETGSCFFTVTQNSQSYVLSSSAGSTANNLTGNNSSPIGNWQGLLTSFGLSSGASVTTPFMLLGP